MIVPGLLGSSASPRPAEAKVRMPEQNATRQSSATVTQIEGGMVNVLLIDGDHGSFAR